MLQLKLRFAFSLVAITGVGIIIAGCGDWSWPGANNNSNSNSSQTGGFNLIFKNNYNPTSDDTGGAKKPSDVTLVWAGEVGEGSGGAGDSFNVTTTELTVFTTDAWTSTGTIVPNLNAGDWSLSVTVNGRLLTCPSPIPLSQGNVFFTVDEADLFAGCS
ncbi:MAG: hypothetical protein WBD22_03635 [Pyrinomonadaceae bacterium]